MIKVHPFLLHYLVVNFINYQCAETKLLWLILAVLRVVPGLVSASMVRGVNWAAGDREFWRAIMAAGG
jgi:hypothetical protein